MLHTQIMFVNCTSLSMVLNRLPSLVWMLYLPSFTIGGFMPLVQFLLSSFIIITLPLPYSSFMLMILSLQAIVLLSLTILFIIWGLSLSLKTSVLFTISLIFKSNTLPSGCSFIRPNMTLTFFDITYLTLKLVKPLALSDPTLYILPLVLCKYLTFTQADITLVVNQVCQCMQSQTDLHLIATKCMLWYMRVSLGFGVKFTPSPLHLSAFTNADWAGDPNDYILPMVSLNFWAPTSFLVPQWKRLYSPRSLTEAEYWSLAFSVTELCSCFLRIWVSFSLMCHASSVTVSQHLL